MEATDKEQQQQKTVQAKNERKQMKTGGTVLEGDCDPMICFI